MRRNLPHRAALLLILALADARLLATGEQRQLPPGAAPRLDAQGDPLPPGAVLRLGNVRFLQEGDVTALAFSPDGKLLATADSDQIRLWDSDSGKEVRCLRGSQGSIQALAFSRDGRLLAAAAKEAISLWDVRAGKEVGKLAGHEKNAQSLAFSPDGSFLASGGEDKAVRLWDVRSCKEVRRCPGKPGAVRALCFFPDGKRLALGSPDEGIHLWHYKCDSELRRLGGHGLRVHDLALSLDGRTLASAHRASVETRRDQPPLPGPEEEPRFCLWDTGSGKKVGEHRSWGREHDRVYDSPSAPDRLVLSPDGTLLVTCGLGHLCWWDVAGRKLLRVSEERMPLVTALAFSPDGKTLAGAGQADNRVWLWDARTGKRKHPWPGHIRGVTSVAFAPNGKSLATASDDGAVRTWELPAGKERLCLSLPGRNAWWSVSYSPDGSVLGGLGVDLSGSFFRGAAVLWRAADGKRLHQFTQEGTLTLAVSFLSDGTALVVCQKETDLFFWDLARDKKASSLANPTNTARCVPGELSLSPDGRYLAFSSSVLEEETNEAYFELSVWSCRTGQKLPAFHGRKKGPMTPAFSHDGRMLAAQGDKGGLAVREVPTGRVLSRLAVNVDIVRALAFRRDGRLLTVGQNDGQVRVWEIATGREVCTFQGRQRDISSVAFAPNGRLLASAAEDATVLVWDLAAWLRGPETPGQLSPAQRDRLWSQLGDPDAAVAYRAVARLAAAPGQAVPFFRERLRPLLAAVEGREERVRRLLAQLDSDEFARRQGASAELEKLGPWEEPALRKVLSGEPSAETRRRIEALLKKPQPCSVPADALMLLRSLQVLEQAGSTEAAAVLKEVAEQLTDERLRHEAQASFRRLAR